MNYIYIFSFWYFRLVRVPRSLTGRIHIKSSMTPIRGNRCKEKKNDNFYNSGDVKSLYKCALRGGGGSNLSWFWIWIFFFGGWSPPDPKVRKNRPIHIFPIAKIEPIHIHFFKLYLFIYFLSGKDTPLIYFWSENDALSYIWRSKKYTPTSHTSVYTLIMEIIPPWFAQAFNLCECS